MFTTAVDQEEPLILAFIKDNHLWIYSLTIFLYLVLVTLALVTFNAIPNSAYEQSIKYQVSLLYVFPDKL